MKRAAILLSVTVALIVPGLTVPLLAKSNDVAQIQALEQSFVDAVKSGDVATIMKVYAPGDQLFVFDVVPPRQYAGFDAYKKDWEDAFASFEGPVTLELSDLAIMSDGHGLAYGHSIQHMTGKMKGGGPFDLTVRVTDVYKKIGGKWLIVQEHVSVPVDLLHDAKADLQSKP